MAAAGPLPAVRRETSFHLDIPGTNRRPQRYHRSTLGSVPWRGLPVRRLAVGASVLALMPPRRSEKSSRGPLEVCCNASQRRSPGRRHRARRLQAQRLREEALDSSATAGAGTTQLGWAQPLSDGCSRRVGRA